MPERSRSRRVAIAAAIGIVLVATGVTAVLVGTPQAGETIPTLGPVIARDTFAEPGPLEDRPLDSDDAFRWHDAAGSWVVRDGEAGPTTAIPSLALVSPAIDAATVGVTVTHLEGGAGLVIGQRDARNYVAVVAAPDFGTWTVFEFHDGRQRVLGNIGLSSVKHGDRITAQWSEREVCVWLESIQHTSEQTCFSTSRPIRGRVGMTADQQPDTVRFDNFVITA